MVTILKIPPVLFSSTWCSRFEVSIRIQMDRSMRIYAVPLEHGVTLRGELNMALPHGGLRGFVRLRAALRR